MIVFWAHLLYLPVGIISKINSIITHFIWGGANMHSKLPLCRLYVICTPKNMDGWGVLCTRNFNCALLIKSFWRAIKSSGIWNKINRIKYFNGDALQMINCNSFTFPSIISCIWRSFKMIIPLIRPRIGWHFRDGSSIPIGALNFLPLLHHSNPSICLLHAFTTRGIFYFSQVIFYWSYGAPIFKSSEQLHLQGPDAVEWDLIRNILRCAGLCYAQGGDQLIWNDPLRNNDVIVKEVYKDIIHSSQQAQVSPIFFSF